MTGQKTTFAKRTIRLLGALSIVLSMIAEVSAGEVELISVMRIFAASSKALQKLPANRLSSTPV